jgi:uncharacterized membrane protein
MNFDNLPSQYFIRFIVVNILSHLLYYLQISTARIMARITEEQIKTVSKIYEKSKSKPKNREKTNRRGQKYGS